MSVKCLTQHQKAYVVYYYNMKKSSQKELAWQFGVSQRTINRVLIEAGVATPVARIQGEAYQVMHLLKKYHLDLPTLKTILNQTEGLSA